MVHGTSRGFLSARRPLSMGSHGTKCCPLTSPAQSRLFTTSTWACGLLFCLRVGQETNRKTYFFHILFFFFFGGLPELTQKVPSGQNLRMANQFAPSEHRANCPTAPGHSSSCLSVGPFIWVMWGCLRVSFLVGFKGKQQGLQTKVNLSPFFWTF